MASSEARLSLDGTERPIVARIESQAEDALVVGRSLPFLRLGNRMVDGEGRAGSIAAVAIRVSDGVPHLLVELAYDAPQREPRPPAVRAKSPRRDPTLGYDARPVRPSSAPPPPSLDATNHDATLSGRADDSGQLEQAFRPSLVPMPLPIPDAAPIALPEKPRPRWPMRAFAFLAALGALFFWWARPETLVGTQ